jgi:putative membrane protein
MFVLVGATVLLGAIYGNPGAIYYPYPFGFSFYWFWPLFGIFFGLWALVFFTSWPLRASYLTGRLGRDPSYQIVRERYARGEITKEQFQQMMHDLGSA